MWRARVGHVTLYLLDTDLRREHGEHDRNIAHQLYGGDRTTRIEQEIVLGVGGVRALGALGLKPTVWHINEGHAAFLILERLRAPVQQGLDFAGALEAVAANTRVHHAHAGARGTRSFLRGNDAALFRSVTVDELGARSARRCCRSAGRPAASEFNMTALAVRGSRFHNGVSRIHGGVSARILARPVAADSAGGKSDHLRHQRRARADLPLAGMGRRFRPLPRLRLEPQAGRRRVAGSSINERAGSRLLEHAPAPEVAVAAPRALPPARAALRATRAAKRTSTGCSACAIRTTRPCSPSASRAASPPTSAPRCCSRISTGCARSLGDPRPARCCSCSPARRTRPTCPGRT